MQGSEVLNSYPWNYHGQHSMHENNKQEYTLESEFLPLKYNNGEYKIEAKSIPIVCPAPFEHPVSYSESSKLDEDQFISQFTEQENQPEITQNQEAGEKPNDLQLELCDRELWDQFSRVGTEMIVTKTGRRMFPGYRIKVSGLNPDEKYCLMMDIVNVDDNRYKFQHGEWTVAGRGEPHLPQRFFLHPDSPAKGSKWMKDPISFHKVKLTNSVGQDIDGKVVLNSMHRYQPRIHIVQTDDVYKVHTLPMYTFAFPQTVFITVTAYQNAEVTKLKIDNNPFAKGFRDDGARSKKTKPDSHDIVREYALPPQSLHQEMNPQQFNQNFTQWMPHHNIPPQHHNNFNHAMPHNFHQQSINPPHYDRFTEVLDNKYNQHFNPEQQIKPYIPPPEYNSVALTSTPQKPSYDSYNILNTHHQTNSSFLPVYHHQDEKPPTSSDSGIGWSPSGSADEDTSLISVGGPECHVENSFSQQNDSSQPTIVRCNDVVSESLEASFAEENHQVQNFVDQKISDEWNF